MKQGAVKQGAVRRLAALLAGPEAGSAALLGASLAGILWANSAARDSYVGLAHRTVSVALGRLQATADTHFVINEGLMAIFFLLVGLEIRRELIEGELASPRHAAAPVLAALGGMIVPAAIYLALCWNVSGARHGWAVPVATDIAFSLAVLHLLGRRVPAGLKVFLTAIAVADDLGAIIVIAVFYAGDVQLAWLGAAAAVWLAMLAMTFAGVRRAGPFLMLTLVLWAAMAGSGIHATLAGAAAAFAIPMAAADSPGRALERELRPWVAFLVLPLFGLMNAGLQFSALPAHALTDPVVLGVVLGLVVGKPVGVFGITRLGCGLGLIRLPGGLGHGLVLGMALLCGIGFTVSLFIGDLAFGGGEREAAVKAAVFAASLLAACGGAAVLLWAGRRATG